MGACNQGKEGFEILISESSLVDTRSATGEGVFTTPSFHSRFVSYPMKANSLRSTYGKRSMLYIIPSHLRIRSRTLTRVLGGILQWAFLRPRCGRYVAHSAPCVAAPLRSVLASSVIAKSTSLIRSCRSVGPSSSLLIRSVSFGSTCLVISKS